MHAASYASALKGSCHARGPQQLRATAPEFVPHSARPLQDVQPVFTGRYAAGQHSPRQTICSSVIFPADALNLHGRGKNLPGLCEGTCPIGSRAPPLRQCQCQWQWRSSLRRPAFGVSTPWRAGRHASVRALTLGAALLQDAGLARTPCTAALL